MEQSSHRQRWTWGGIAVALAVLLSGCDSGSASRGASGITGPAESYEGTRTVEVEKKRKRNPDAPVISNLRIEALDPEQPNRDVRYRVRIDFADRNGDVLEGEGEILLNKESIGRKRIERNGGDLNATEGTLEGVFWVHAFRPVKVKGAVRIFDRAGNQSNELTFVLQIGEVRTGEHYEIPAGAVTGRIESVTVGR